MPSRAQWRTMLVVLIACAGSIGACGGGGGDDGGGSKAPGGTTTFTGNVLPAAGTAAADGDTALAAASPVQVCVAGTNFCTSVDGNGTFTLDASVGGDVVLVFEGPDFSARLGLSNVPRGATVQIRNIECSTVSGRCEAEDVQIVSPLNEAPLCDGAMARPAVLWPPNHRMVGIAIVGVVDPDGDRVVVRATDVFSNEPVDAPGSGNTAPDAQLSPLAVRAERSGQGSGRVYSIPFVADDGKGGTCSGTVQVCVPHDQGQGSACG
jgi:hypothetical protein